MVLRGIWRTGTTPNFRFSNYLRVLGTPLVSEMYIASHPLLRENRLTRETQLVIDGYPRSANTYSQAAFEELQGSSAGLVSHLHTPRVVIRAINWGIPCIVLVREPGEAVSSLVQLMPGVRPRTALDLYTAYYERLVDHRDSVVVAEFRAVTRDFPQVLERCNQMFGTNFCSKPLDAAAQKRISARIDDLAARFDQGESHEAVVARPSAKRKSASNFIDGLGDREREALFRAREIYQLFV